MFTTVVFCYKVKMSLDETCKLLDRPPLDLPSEKRITAGEIRVRVMIKDSHRNNGAYPIVEVAKRAISDLPNFKWYGIKEIDSTHSKSTKFIEFQSLEDFKMRGAQEIACSIQENPLVKKIFQ